MKIVSKIWLLLLFFCFTVHTEAKVKLPILVSDGMVLQREQNVTIWGWADAGEEVKIKFRNKQYKTTATNDGTWEIALPPLKAGGPYSMNVNDIELNDIMIGDVWLCSGQSNMELPISRVLDLYRDEVASYSNTYIRHIKVPLDYDFHEEKRNVKPTSWKKLTPQNAISFSAVGYFFAKDIYEKTKVPVGIINASVGGSPAEAWINEEGLKEFPKYLNEKRICESDDYVKKVMLAERQERNEWNAVARKHDEGLTGRQRWSSATYNDSSWNSINLFDTSWGTDGLNPVNGVFWFRKNFEASKAQAGQKATLRMGCIVDADSVFVNGVFVGTTSYQYPPRIYQIPENVLKEGVNNITVRLFSYSGYPHFVKDKPYKIIVKNTEIDLTGEWKYKLGIKMPAQKGETFFHYKPEGLFNGMIAPLKKCNIKGVLWYQGESNTGRYNDYYDLMATLIREWRAHFSNPDLPFMMVQLPNFMQSSTYPRESHWAEMRNAQLQLSKNIPNTALVVTIDIGEWNDIHPLNKKEVGRRLSLQAQRMVYGNNVVSDGPVYDSMTVEGNKIILTFKESTNDLMPVDELKGFAIAGNDGKYQWANARIENKKVIVWNDSIPAPVMVRYAWDDNPEGANLRNKDGLPATPFQIKNEK